MDIKELFLEGLKNKTHNMGWQGTQQYQHTKKQWQAMGVAVDWPETNTTFTLDKGNKGEQSYKVGNNGNFIKIE